MTKKKSWLNSPVCSIGIESIKRVGFWWRVLVGSVVLTGPGLVRLSVALSNTISSVVIVFFHLGLVIFLSIRQQLKGSFSVAPSNIVQIVNIALSRVLKLLSACRISHHKAWGNIVGILIGVLILICCRVKGRRIDLRRCIGEEPTFSQVHIANGFIAAFWSVRVVIDERWVNGPILSIISDVDSLLAEYNSTLPLRSLNVNILGVMNDLSMIIEGFTFRQARTNIFWLYVPLVPFLSFFQE